MAVARRGNPSTISKMEKLADKMQRLAMKSKDTDVYAIIVFDSSGYTAFRSRVDDAVMIEKLREAADSL